MTTESHPVVSPEEWRAAHAAHLAREKALTRQRDALRAERQALPWVKVDKAYVFDSQEGGKNLADLFEGRSQLIIKHFMFGPGWKEGCVGCSFEMDHIQAALQHLEQHDVKFAAVSRAPLAEILPFKERMGWHFDWLSSYQSDFNYDFHVSFTEEQVKAGKGYYNFTETDIPVEELSGLSCFYRDSVGDVFHTFSAFGRGAEEVLGTYMLLDMTAKGRNETGPSFNLTDWVRHHDRYDAGGHVDETGRYRSEASCCHESE
ncbi:DUF899 domain-containing protein [Marinobacter sp. M1N3S26]|uniref:DUF899 domain-containing protein n=1 Tax=Marinobacter sp. M1N3S26 TaxID=3382299 RepID=UPI00387A844B